MLGVPVAMWNPWEESDTVENLDFSVLPTIPQLNPSILHNSLETIQPNLWTLLLFHPVFRPPEFSL